MYTVHVQCMPILILNVCRCTVNRTKCIHIVHNVNGVCLLCLIMWCTVTIVDKLAEDNAGTTKKCQGVSR